MSLVNIPTKEEVSASNQDIFDQLEKALGFVPNLYATMAHSTNGLKRYLDFQNAKTSFSNREKEIINIVVSQVNNCKYCQSAHTVIGKLNGFNDEEILAFRKLTSDNKKYDSLVKLTASITETKGYVAEALVSEFYANGYTKENLVDLILQVSDKTAMNFLHNLTQIEIDFPLAPEL